MSSVIKKGHMAQPDSLQNGYMYDNGQKSGKLTLSLHGITCEEWYIPFITNYGATTEAHAITYLLFRKKVKDAEQPQRI